MSGVGIWPLDQIEAAGTWIGQRLGGAAGQAGLAPSTITGVVDAAIADVMGGSGDGSKTGGVTGGGATTGGVGVASGTAVTAGGLAGGSVTTIQHTLQAAGFNLGPAGVDGDFGACTAAALRAYIEVNGEAAALHVFGSDAVRRARSITRACSVSQPGGGGQPTGGGGGGGSSSGGGGGGGTLSTVGTGGSLSTFLSPTMLLIALPLLAGVGLLGWELYQRSKRGKGKKKKGKGKKKGKRR